MPFASAGANITDSAQINPGVIVNADINAAAAIDYSKLNLTNNIVNADIDDAAAIVDTKLAQITTASKVHGTAITGLASLPAGAGVIPLANLPGGATAHAGGVFTKNLADATGGTNVIAHGLGSAPSKVRARIIFANASEFDNIELNWIEGTQYRSQARMHATTSYVAVDTTDPLVFETASVTAGQSVDVTVDATNVTFTWTKTGSPTGSRIVFWEAVL